MRDRLDPRSSCRSVAMRGAHALDREQVGDAVAVEHRGAGGQASADEGQEPGAGARAAGRTTSDSSAGRALASAVAGHRAHQEAVAARPADGAETGSTAPPLGGLQSRSTPSSWYW